MLEDLYTHMYHGDKCWVLQLISKRHESIEPVWGPLVKANICCPSDPAGVHHICPEEG